MKTKQGEFVGPYEATEDHTVQGRLTGAVTVRSGACLVVQGLIDGTVEVEADAVLNVQGLFSAQVAANEGLIMIAGMTTEMPWTGSLGGRYAVAEGTLIQVRGENYSLGRDGAFEDLVVGPDGKVNIDQSASAASNYLAFDHQEERFVRLDRDDEDE
ncbi:hypothetical protein ACVW00_003549 [Marmoricola sp. URHA0025 HA25]